MTSKLGSAGLLGLYWGPRREPLEACARRLHEALRALQLLGYERYFDLGRSRKDALERPIEITPEHIFARLAKGVHRTDSPPRKVIADLGFGFSAWSGDPDGEAYSLSVSCGAWWERASNTFVMKLPRGGPFSLAVAPERALEAYGALLPIWEPDQAILCEGRIEWRGRTIVALQGALAQHPARAH